jgi:hypothetical protein
LRLAVRAGLAGLALSLATAVAAAPGIPPQAPVEVLPMAASLDGLSGPGGERLRSELQNAQFIAVGEDHGLADAPELTAALATEADRIKGAPLYHAVEVGPHTTRLITAELKQGGLVALDRLLEGKPALIPFLSNAEDARLALPFARSGRLWGIDQEFIGSLPVLCDLLMARTRDADVQRRLRDWRDQDLANLPAGRFDKAAMTATDLATFEALRPALKGDALANRILDDLIASARVYQFNYVGRYMENNEERSYLMRDYFLEHYSAVKGPKPRVILKLGAFHLGRGTTPTAIYDIGSILPGLAAANGQRSLHIVFMPMGGKVRAIAPSPQGFTAVKDYEEDVVPKLLDVAGIIRDRVPEKGLILIPLKPLRQRLTGDQRKAMGTFGTFIVQGFDYLVTTRDARPATHFEAWPAP